MSIGTPACSLLVRLASMATGLLGGAASRLHTGAADRCMAIGIVLLIALPGLRVALAKAVFLYERDSLFAAISAAVLAIIALGFVPGHRRRPLTAPRGGRAIEAIRSRSSRCSSCETRRLGVCGRHFRSG